MVITKFFDPVWHVMQGRASMCRSAWGSQRVCVLTIFVRLWHLAHMALMSLPETDKGVLTEWGL